MPLEDDIDRLSRVPFFSVMEPDALRLLAFASESHPFATGQFLFRRGEPADGGYLIVSGLVEISTTEEPDEDRRVVGAGTLLGEKALLVETPRLVSARASKPSSTLSITRTMFTRALREYPDSARIVRQVWARRLHERLSAE